MSARAYTTRLVEKVPRVADIVSFRLERPQGYQFQAGQWFVVTFAGPGDPYTHHFSHSNSPLDGELELTTRLRGSEFKNALDALPLGAEVEIEGPYGSFIWPEGVERLALVAGGIGITCGRGILRWLAGRPGDFAAAGQSLVLLFANQSENAIPFRAELEDLQDKLPGFRVIHVISRAGEDWQGYRGHIDGQILERELPEPWNWTYYLSGPPSFGSALQELLVSAGVPVDSIKVERFEGY